MKISKAAALCSIYMMVMIVLGLSSSHAQTANTGALSGTVTDTTGAAVGGAEIKVVDESTGQIRRIQSGGDGRYIAPLIPPGTYRVEVAKTGFKVMVYNNILVQVTETATLNINLPIGTQTEQVTVQAQSEQLKTQSAELGQTTDARFIEGLPLASRNYTEIMALNPGMSTEGNDAGALGPGAGGLNQSSATGTTGFSANGGTTWDNNFQMNGVEVSDLQNGGFFSGGVPIPNPDAIQEFKVVTQPYDAGSGRNAGANVDVITKGGSNSLHGSAFEYFRNDALNANLYFLEANGQPRPVLRQNQYGGSLGGPIKQDKLFFFGSYQGTHQQNGVSSNCSATEQTPPLTDDRSAAALGALFAGQQSLRTIVGGNGVGPAIMPDGSNIDPAALKIMQFKLPNGTYAVPTPQRVDPSRPFDSQGSSAFSVPCPYTQNQFVANGDFLHTPKSTLSGRFFFANDSLVETMPGGRPPGAPWAINFDYRTASLSHTYVLSNLAVNQVSIGYNRVVARHVTESPFTYSDVGIAVNPFEDPHPVMNIARTRLGGRGQSDRYVNAAFSVQDTLTYTRGRHSFHFGGGHSRLQDNSLANQQPGSLFFNTFADFLLGFNATQNTSASLGEPFSNVFGSLDLLFADRSWRVRSGNAYAQDDIRLTDRLTVNLGFRYERVGDFSEIQGRQVAFFPSLANPNPPAAGTLAGWVVPANFKDTVPAGVTRNGNNYGMFGLGQNTWNPRFGFAWRIPGTERIVLRGGYGLFHSRSTGTALLASSTAPPFGFVRAFFGQPNANATLDNPFQPFDLASLPSFNNVFYSPTTSNTVYEYAPDYRPPSVQHYSLGTQAQVTKDLVLEIGYVGQRGTNLIQWLLPNQAQLASPTNPIRGETTNTIDNIQLRVPIQGFASNSMNFFSSKGVSLYNALQTSLSKRFGKGLQVLASYTWARSLTNALDINTLQLGGQVWGNQFHPPYGPDDFVREQRFVVSYYYELPHPSSSQSILGRVLGGWAVSGVTVAQSGQRLSVVNSSDGTNVYGINMTLPNLVPGCAVMNRGSLTNYINPSCFTEPRVIGADGLGTDFGTGPVGLITGPRQVNTDFSIIKRTAIGWPRESSLEFRSDFFNVFNHPQFVTPDNDISSSGFGTITSTLNNPRIIQFAVRFSF